MEIEAWINDEGEEYIMNLVAQEYYSEAWEFIARLTDNFHKGLYIIAGRVLEENELLKGKCDCCNKTVLISRYGKDKEYAYCNKCVGEVERGN